MRKFNKGLFSWFMILVLVLSFNLTVFADSPNPSRIPAYDGDVAYAPNGGTWHPNDSSIAPLLYHHGICYLTTEQTDALWKAKTNLNILQNAFNMGVSTATCVWLAGELGITTGGASWLLGMGVGVVDWIANNIDTYLFQQAVNSSSEEKISITSYQSGTLINGNIYWTFTNNYQPWSGNYIYGEENVEGYFDLSDHIPPFN